MENLFFLPPLPQENCRIEPYKFTSNEVITFKKSGKIQVLSAINPSRPPSPNTSRVLPPIELRSHMLGAEQKYYKTYLSWPFLARIVYSHFPSGRSSP